MPITENTAKHDITPVAKPGEAHDSAAQEAQKKLAAEAAAAAKAKAEAEAKAKAEEAARAKAKAEAESEAKKKLEEKQATTAPSGSLLDSLASGVKKAGSLAWDTATSYLPTMSFFHGETPKAEIKHEQSQLNIKDMIQNTCSGDTCKVDSNVLPPGGSLPGFELTDKKQPAWPSSDKVDLTLSKENKELLLSYIKDSATIDRTKASDVEKLAIGDVHRDKNGRVDGIRLPDGTIKLISENGETTEVRPDGTQIRHAANGDFMFERFADGRIKKGALKEGGFAQWDEATKSYIMTDRNGQIVARLESGKKTVAHLIFTDNDIIVQNDIPDFHNNAGYLDGLRKQSLEAHRSFIHVTDKATIVVGADGTMIGAQKDGTTFISVGDDHYLVRNTDGSFELFGKGETSSQKFSKEQLKEMLLARHLKLWEINAIKFAMSEFARCHTIIGANNTKLTVNNGEVKVVSGATELNQRNLAIQATDTKTGRTASVDIGTGEAQTTDAQGHKTELTRNQNGEPIIHGAGYTAVGDQVQTDNGDHFVGRTIQMANGTQYDGQGRTKFIDGSSFNADNSVTARDGTRISSVAEQQQHQQQMTARQEMAVKEAQAASMTAYAEGIAGSLRGLAASGHASAGDLAALESAYSSICSAVMSLGDECDPSARVKLMMAQDDIGSSLDITLAAVSRKDEQIIKAEDKLTANGTDSSRTNLLAALRYEGTTVVAA